ncbi:MAG: FAD/NAD(P)-binding protein, partial [Nakamurella sp.]
VIERLAANSAELLGPGELHIHVVDPYPAGGGRIWRTTQSELLWMNSMARDVTIFTDDSVKMQGPVVGGPTLDQWIVGDGAAILAAAGLGEQARATGPDDFASRQVQAHYLQWAYQRAVAALPARVRVSEHRTQAIGVTERHNRQSVLLADGSTLPADVAVLAQGFLDRDPDDEEIALTAAAEAEGLTYIPPGYTADVDLSELRPGEPVIVRGFGLAFVDLMVLLGEGRGGRFSGNSDGTLTYHPSGAEPILHVGSRRGVPYHAKLGYALPGSAPAPTRYFTSAAVTALGGDRRPADFQTEIWPLLVKELAAAHYRELFTAHPERTLRSWPEFSAVMDTADVLGQDFAEQAELAVPKQADRFDIPSLDRPFAGVPFESADRFNRAVVQYIRSDVSRRADSYYSQDAAVFDALLAVYGVLAMALTSGKVSATDRVRFVEGQFHGFFSFLASGPPPRRLAELLALHQAGLVYFAGPDLQLEVTDGAFQACSPAFPGAVRARALVDARLPRPDVKVAADPVIRGLLADGELAAEHLTGPDGRQLVGGQLLADRCCRAIRQDRSIHPRRFLLGPSVSGSAGAAGFARPGFNGPGFRQNDAVAREILRLLQVPGHSNHEVPTHTYAFAQSEEKHHAS